MKNRVGALAAAVAGVVVAWAAAPGLAQQTPPAPADGALPPPLEDGMVWRATQSGCQVARPVKDEAWEKNKPWTWSGACRNGLAHGTGELAGESNRQLTIVKQVNEYVFGHPLNRYITRTEFGDTVNYGTFFVSSVGLNNTDQRLGATWSQPGASTQIDLMYKDASGASKWIKIEAFRDYCTEFERNKMSPAKREANKGCSSQNYFQIDGVRVFTDGEMTETYCPRMPAPCDAVWKAAIAPYTDTIQDIVARSMVDDEVKRDTLTAAFTKWENENKRIAEEKRAVAAEAVRKAAEEKQAAETAERQRVEQEFKASLAGMNAGQLFAKADELDEQGKGDLARVARRQLISNFPNSPLANTAAQQLSGGGSAASSAASSGASASSGSAAKPASSASASPAPAAPAGGVAANGCATPNTGPNNPAFLKYQRDIFDFEEGWRSQGDKGGSRDLYQYMIFMMTNNLRILETHKQCLSNEDYLANKNYFTNALNTSKQGCERTAAGPNSCTPEYPSNWGKPPPRPR